MRDLLNSLIRFLSESSSSSSNSSRRTRDAVHKFVLYRRFNNTVYKEQLVEAGRLMDAAMKRLAETENTGDYVFVKCLEDFTE